ncbi:DUF4190 domain-containing protein [Kineococcus sp. SYSU DK003]|uniref:DUF4190 domain-containing protein n=1 Tax=Kineococcus sp. SYSU DK003 TaxID=3383124 RepID=UPI003D7EDB37
MSRPPGAASTDGFSIAALVTGVVGIGPVAFALGAVGLHRTGSRRTPGRGFAVAGMVLGGLQMLAASAAAVLLVVGVASGTLPALRTGTVAIDDLASGDCFDTGEDQGLTGTVQRTACADRHDGEVLEVIDLGGGAYPGEDSLVGLAEDQCAADAGDAVEAAGLDPDDFEYGYFYPLEQNWAEGSHLVQCTIHGWGGELSGSVLQGDATVGP